MSASQLATFPLNPLPHTQHLAPNTQNPLSHPYAILSTSSAFPHTQGTPISLLTLYKIPLTINTMTSHKDHRLDQLGIASQDEADELQRELGIRFDQFTYHDRKVWNQQNSYLQAHARTRTVSDSADLAGVTVSTAQAWKYLDTLGFTHRLEIADLRFSDSLQVTALERAREPDAPASLLIALLRAHIPEKYSANGHLCDTSKSDELLFHYRQDAQRELAAGHPTLRAIANGTYQPPHITSTLCRNTPLIPPVILTPAIPDEGTTPSVPSIPGGKVSNGSSRFKRIRPRNRLII